VKSEGLKGREGVGKAVQEGGRKGECPRPTETELYACGSCRNGKGLVAAKKKEGTGTLKELLEK